MKLECCCNRHDCPVRDRWLAVLRKFGFTVLLVRPDDGEPYYEVDAPESAEPAIAGETAYRPGIDHEAITHV